MATFYATLTYDQIAQQIAELINQYNNLTVLHNYTTICNSSSIYVYELSRQFTSGNRVVGCVGIQQLNSNISKIKHLCVSPSFRKQGIGERLLNRSIALSKTKNVMASIREDNVNSLNLFKSLNFKEVSKNNGLIIVSRSI